MRYMRLIIDLEKITRVIIPILIIHRRLIERSLERMLESIGKKNGMLEDGDRSKEAIE